jgi:hypothetical protein
VSLLKRQSQNASAAIASCAKEKDFHNRTSSLTTQASRRSKADIPLIPADVRCSPKADIGTWPSYFWRNCSGSISSNSGLRLDFGACRDEPNS